MIDYDKERLSDIELQLVILAKRIKSGGFGKGELHDIAREIEYYATSISDVVES